MDGGSSKARNVQQQTWNTEAENPEHGTLEQTTRNAEQKTRDAFLTFCYDLILSVMKKMHVLRYFCDCERFAKVQYIP